MTGSTFRLTSPAGLLLDRSRPVGFRFEGRSYEAFAGDTIASALAASGRYLLSRSFKYHRPRGLMTGAGHDTNCLVQIGAEPNVPADSTLVVEGMDVRGLHYRGTLDNDRDAIFDKLSRFMPVGFYYRAFFRPHGVWQGFWEPIIRRRTGLGRVDPEATHDRTEQEFLFCDVAVIGAGPAGLAAACAAANSGADVILVDENIHIGGALTHGRFDADGALGWSRFQKLSSAVNSAPGITVLDRAVCTGLYADNWLSIIGQNRFYKLRARAVVLATGCIEQPLVFRNNDLPGIMVGSAAQRLMRLYAVKPGTRAVLLAGHEDTYGVALDLADAGVDIAAVFDLRQNLSASPLAAEASRRGIPIKAARRVDEALPDATGHRVARCVVDGISTDCDLVCMSAGYMPAYHLAAQGGAHISHDERSAKLTVKSTSPAIWLAGSLAGHSALEAVIASGARAGSRAGGGDMAATTIAGEASKDEEDQLASPIFPHTKGKEFVDFDEDLQIADLTRTVDSGYVHVELVKRYSTVGMGPSQGRHSALNAARVVAASVDRFARGTTLTTARPPIKGEPLGLLAGQGFHPERLTPMHHRHVELGAQMMAVGAWWRPLFYGPPSAFERATDAEVGAVRDNVGMIDVSTLGKFQIRGPDAAEFIDRLYTSRHATQPVGRIRYLLMTNEAGTIVDDGVAARLGDQHFYLTATTGAADATFRQMLWWNAQWRLKVDVANVTSGVAAINVAGPRSRDVVQSLAAGVDLSPEGFPYLHVRDAALRGVPIRMMRIGFLGELSYEIHAPATYGEAIWEALLEAGKPLGMLPIGIEAQRRLRLEKGHVIIGQDTDGLTTPAAAGMDWAVAKGKPFFVGARSLAALSKLPLKRRLAGFTLPLKSEVPPESSLVIENGKLVGVVTSCARSRRCAAVVGLALIHPRLAVIGGCIMIRLPDGSEVAATIVKTPFYDPNGLRQAL